MLISIRRHSVIYWWISKSNSSKESCCEVEYEAYDKIHMWRISIVFLHILIFYLIISNQRHSIIYWWISKSNSSKESCCEVEYEVYDKIHMWRISIVFFAYFDFLFDEPLKHDTYSPYISLIICIITYYPLAIFWAITFENPSINEETAAIWNYASFFCYCSCPQC